jgi:hypothetical protein
MPISVKKDVKKAYGFGNHFSLRETPLFIPLGGGKPILFGDVGGQYVKAVRPRIAEQNWYDFYGSWDFVNAKRDLTKAIAKKFNLKVSEENTFNELWKIVRNADDYKNKVEDDITADIDKAYKHVAKVAAGQDINKSTFSRVENRHDNKFVVFSDHHMTAFKNKPNYFKDFCLVENGDIEECIIYEPTLPDAEVRASQAPGLGKFPITFTSDKWIDFINTRYTQRLDNLNKIIVEFHDYYECLRTSFISKNKYVKIAGNHDTYLNESNERELRNRIQGELEGINVCDILRISRSNEIEYLILHGHQFDTVSLQHGSIPFAKSLGEVYSECLSWAFQGPDRVWTLQDTKKWYFGDTYQNILAKEEPGDYIHGSGGLWDLLWSNIDQIREDSKNYVETLLGHEVAWEYFENNNGFEALTLEVLTGEEMYKLRHMNESKLCERYASEFLNLQSPPDFSAPIPKLVLGHTHEPRQNAEDPNSPRSYPYYYLNSGSAGRYENLIWCVEILENSDRICSWSKVDGKLKKIIWRSEQDKLVHDSIEWLSF